MKISLLSAFYPYRGGIAQFGAMLFRALEKDHDVKAFTFKRQYPGFLFPGSTQFVQEGDNADPIPAARVLDTTNPLSFSRTARVIKNEEPDLVISQYWMTFFGPAFGSIHKRLKGTKRITILHNVIPHEKRFFDAPANRYFLKYNDGFVVMSDKVLADLLSIRPNAKYLRIDHPIYSQFGERMKRAEALNQLKLNEDRKYLLFFGFIRDYKGLDILLEALSDLSPDIHLIIAGEVYGSFEKYDQIIKESDLKKRVHIYDQYIADEEVSKFFSAADVCVLPYKGATQSGITAISKHFEIPSIVTDVGGLKENVKHNETGLVVDSPRPHLIANAIKAYYRDDLQEKFSSAIAGSKGEEGWDRFADKIIEFARSL